MTSDNEYPSTQPCFDDALQNIGRYNQKRNILLKSLNIGMFQFAMSFISTLIGNASVCLKAWCWAEP